MVAKYKKQFISHSNSDTKSHSEWNDKFLHECRLYYSFRPLKHPIYYNDRDGGERKINAAKDNISAVAVLERLK